VRTGSASRGSTRGQETRQRLIEATIETLRSDGFASATAREISRRAGCNQALVFYHFGSVVELLLAALDEVSARRWERFGQALSVADGPSEVVDLAARVFEEDLDSGDAALLVEMIAGASSTPGLGAEIKTRLTPWTGFAREAVERALGSSTVGSVVQPDELANALVALYLGLELLSHLDGDRTSASTLFARARQLAPLIAAVGWRAQPQPESPPRG
jgi:AcrR family transcriptional regulator